MSSLKVGDIIKKRYEIMDELGDGCYATVYLVQDVLSHELFALKATRKRHLKDNSELGPNLVREVRIHSNLDHPNILKFYREFDDKDYIYFLLEFITPGEIYDVLYDDQSSDSTSNDDPFSEDEARDYFIQIIEALRYLRNKGIIHRDIKPENILLTEDGVIKIADFGWATTKPSDSIVGTPEYNAPEMLREIIPGQKKYDYKSDLWSAGVVLYEFLFKKRPFHPRGYKNKKEKEKATERLICSGKIPWPDEPDVSDLAKDLIKRILTINPIIRPDYEEVLAHPWMLMAPETGRSRSRTKSRSRSRPRPRSSSRSRSRERSNSYLISRPKLDISGVRLRNPYDTDDTNE